MDFSEALKQAKEGNVIYREGWIGKDIYVTQTSISVLKPDVIYCLAIIKKDGSFANLWLPSNADLYATDWKAIE
jgi:hypothetical protein